MNLILLYPDDYIDDDKVCLTDYRHSYVRDIHRPAIGDTLKVGNLSGCLGDAIVEELNASKLVMQVKCDQPAPSPLPLTLILALPRPKVFKRVLLTATTLGIKQIVVCNSWRVDKSYWSSPVLGERQIMRQLVTGLEQAKDTQLPTVLLRNRFKPFVEDELPQIISNSRAYVAHPAAKNSCPKGFVEDAASHGKQHITVAIGPEGGFIPYEVEKLVSTGFQPVSFGERILRVETALSWIAGHM